MEDAQIETVLDQLRHHALLDDEAFAEYWVDQRRTFRPRGARLVRAELTRLGVSRVGAAEATAALEASAETDAYRAASQRATRLRGLPPEAFRTRLAAYLLRRGFDWEAITPVVERLSQAPDGGDANAATDAAGDSEASPQYVMR